MRIAPFALAASALAATLLPVPASRLAAQEIVAEDLDDERPAGSGLSELELEAERLFAEDDLDGAIALYRQLASRLDEPGEQARVLVLAAWLEHLAGREDRALAALAEALVEAPDREFRPELYSERFRDLYLEAQAEALRQRDQAAYEAFNRGLERMRARDYPAARAAFHEALGYRGGHPQALYNLALVELYDGRHDEALAGFEKLLALPPRAAGDPGAAGDELRALALTNVGFLFNRRQLWAEAEEALERAVALDARNASAWSNLGVSRRRLGQRSAAAEAFRRAHDLDPDDPGVMNNLALAYIDTGEWIAAVALLKKATGRHPENASMWLNLGLAQAGMGNPAGAVESWEAAIRNDPGNAGGWASAAALHLANHFLETGDPARAQGAAERALAWRPEAADGWIYQGLAQRARGDLEGARRSLEQARQLDATRPRTHNNLGSVYFELGLLDEAEAAFERAVAIAPDLAEARENLAAVAATRAARAAGTAAPPTRAAPPPSAAPPPAVPTLRLGLRFAAVDYAALGIKGVMVESVVPGTLAGRAGIQPRDLILKVDGRDVTAPDHVERFARESGKDRVAVDLLRDNLPKRIEMRLDSSRAPK